MKSAAEWLAPIFERRAENRLDARQETEAHLLWGTILLTQEDPEAALVHLQKALRGNAEFRHETAATAVEAALAIGDTQSAREVLDSIPGASTKSWSLRLVGHVDLAAGNSSDAIKSFEASFRLEPSADAALQLGMLRYEALDLPAARLWFDAALHHDPRSYYARVFRARVALQLGDLGSCASDAEILIEEFETPEALTLAGRVAQRKKEWSNAAAMFRRALKIEPRNLEARFGLATSLRRLADDDAGEEFARFRRQQRQDSETRRRLESAEQLLLREPQRVELHLNIAQSALEIGDMQKAESHAWAAVRSNRHSREPRFFLAATLRKQGRYRAASVQYQRILVEHPDDPQARALLKDLIDRHSRPSTRRDVQQK